MSQERRIITELPWLVDSIPSDWQVKRLKDIFEESSEVSLSGDEDLLSVSEYYGVAKRKDKMTEDDEFETRADTLEGYKVCHKGDLVSNIMLTWKRALGISEFEGIVSPAYAVYRGKNIFPKYYHYLLRSDMYIAEFKRNSKGIIESRLRLYSDRFFSIKTIYPPLVEQEKIARYLDEKITGIDAYISDRERELQLLKQLKQAKINEVVTRSLQDNVPMKDSGISAIGFIPEHWEVRRLKDLFEFGSGLPISKADLVEEGVPVISYGQIHAKFNRGTRIDERLLRYVSPSYIETNPSSLVNIGDVIFADTSEDLEGCGNCVYVDKKMTLFAGYHTVILRRKRENPFLAYLFQSQDWRLQIRKQVAGVKLYSITKSILNNVSVILPPLSEQLEIVNYLDKECELIEKKCALIVEQIEKLQLLKRTLINEVVTGKRRI